MTTFLGIIFAVIILSILVIIHEFGHFIVARMNGIFVKEFSVGFGPRIISKVSKKSGTRFSWKVIPFGGSCMMLGQYEDEDEGTDDERSFESKSVWARMSVILAGPLFNIFLGFVIAVVYVGVSGYDPATVTAVEEGGAAEEAGLEEGDLITSYNGAHINFGREVYLEQYLQGSAENPVKITVERGGEEIETTVTPKQIDYYMFGISYQANTSKCEIEVTEGGAADSAGLRDGDIITAIGGTAISTGEDLRAYFDENPLTGEEIEVEFLRYGKTYTTAVTPVLSTKYSLGFSYNLSDVKTSGIGVLKYSLAEMKYEITAVYKSLWILVSGQGSLDMLSGPVGIVQVVGETYETASSYGVGTTVLSLLNLMMMLSINLGILNLLPLPALDGGKFIILIIEAIRRKRVSRTVEGVVTLIGAGLLVVLMVVVLINDVLKFL